MDLAAIMESTQANIECAYELKMLVPQPRMKKNILPEDWDSMTLDGKWDIIDDDFIMERIEGVPVSFVAYWTGEKFILGSMVLKDRHIADGSRGPKLYENTNTLMASDLKIISKYMQRLVEEDKEFTGFIDIEVILSNSVYYQRINTAITEDVMFCLSEMYNIDPVDFYDTVAGLEDTPDAKSLYSCSMRLYSYPYEPEVNKKIINIALDGLRECEDCFILVARGDRLKSVWKKVKAQSYQLPKYVLFRTDADSPHRRMFNALRAGGHINATLLSK